MRENRRKFIKGIAVTGAVGFAGCTGDGSGQDRTTVSYAGSSSGGTNHNFAIAAQQVFRENSDQVELNVEETEGSRANVQLLAQQEYDAGGASLYNFRGNLEEVDYEAVPLQGAANTFGDITMMALEGTGIETWDDLAGKNVWPFWRGQITYDATLDLLETFGLRSEVNIVNVTGEDVAGAIDQGRIDAFLGIGVAGFATGPWQRQIDALDIEIHTVDMTEEQKRLLQDEHPDLPYREIVPYGWDEHEFDEPSDHYVLSTVIWFQEYLDEDVVYHILEVLSDHAEELQDAAAVIDFSNPENMVEPLASPDNFEIHPGAESFYKDNDVWPY